MRTTLLVWLARLALILAAVATADLLDGYWRAIILSLIVAIAIDAGRLSVKYGQATA